MTGCINSATLNRIFLDELKLVDVTPLYKKADPDEKTNYQPISMWKNILLTTKFIARKKTLSSFMWISFEWQYTSYLREQSNIDLGGYVGIILMDLS